MRPIGLTCPIGQRWLAVLSLALAAALAACAQPQALRRESPFLLTLEPVAATGQAVDVRVALAFPPRHVIYAESFRVVAEGQATSLERISLPAPDRKPDLAEPAKQVGVYAHPFESLWRLSPRRDGVSLRIEYQGCDDKACFMPEAHTFRYDMAAGRFAESIDSPAPVEPEPSWLAGRAATAAGGYLSPAEFLAFLDRAEGRADTSEKTGLAGFLGNPVAFFHAHGLALTVLLILLGGFLLNLTPCVLPMIPVNLLILGAGAGTRTRGFALGSAYGAGMVLVYGGLGWGVVRSGRFFGVLQASPWFSLAVALVFAALTLAMFGVFAIDLGRLSSSPGGRRQGAFAAFSAGALSALLAGACIAPVVLAVLLLAGSLYAGGSAEAQFLPFVLGLGMALPWPFAGAGLAVLPAPGPWMVRVKQVFGCALAVLAAYYLYLAGVGFTPVARGVRDGSIEAGDALAWQTRVAQATREGKPILVDFWAGWCKNCSAMERGTFADARVQARLNRYVVVRVQSECPEKEPAKAMLAAFGVRGLPGFVVLK